MKNILYTVVFIFLSQNLFSQYVSQTDAELVAKNFIESNLYGQLKSTSAATKTIESTHLKSYNGHDSYYTVNFQNGGVVVVSAIEEFKPIIAYSISTTIDNSNLPPDYEWWMEQYDIWIDSIIQNNVQNTGYSDSWSTLKSATLSQLKSTGHPGSGNAFFLLTSEWGQSGCHSSGTSTYNKFVNDGGKGASLSCACNTDPKCPTGCVATAIGQVMRYWGYPDSNFDWCNMPDDIGLFSNTVEVDAIASLLADIGNKVDMDYCSDNKCSSGANTKKDGTSALHDYGYGNADYKSKFWTIQNWRKLLREELDAGRPVLYRGYSGDGGHAWVVDGYDRDDNELFHFNWGWHGSQNMYYYLKDGNDYKKRMGAIINIQPDYFVNCNSSTHLAESMQYWEDYSIQIIGHPEIPAPSLYLTPNPVGTLVNGGDNANSDYRTIKNGQTAVYKAYNEIRLEPGFTAEAGSNFTARIVDCPALCSRTSSGLKSAQVTSFNSELIDDQSELIDKTLQLDTQFQFNVYPNPTSNSLSVKLNLPTEEVFTISFYSTASNLIFSSQGYQPQGLVELSYDLSSFDSGIYFCTYKSKNYNRTIRVIKN